MPYKDAEQRRLNEQERKRRYLAPPQATGHLTPEQLEECREAAAEWCDAGGFDAAANYMRRRDATATITGAVESALAHATTLDVAVPVVADDEVRRLAREFIKVLPFKPVCQCVNCPDQYELALKLREELAAALDKPAEEAKEWRIYRDKYTGTLRRFCKTYEKCERHDPHWRVGVANDLEAACKSDGDEHLTAGQASEIIQGWITAQQATGGHAGPSADSPAESLDGPSVAADKCDQPWHHNPDLPCPQCGWRYYYDSVANWITRTKGIVAEYCNSDEIDWVPWAGGAPDIDDERISAARAEEIRRGWMAAKAEELDAGDAGEVK
jgi:hypothetical protein